MLWSGGKRRKREEESVSGCMRGRWTVRERGRERRRRREREGG